jgi:hypothetical protein
MARFLQDRQLDCLISAGFAGALNDQLTLAISARPNFSTAELGKARPLLANLPIHVANLLTVPSIIDSSEERNRIARATGAAAVDMETELSRALLREHGVPLLCSARSAIHRVSTFPALAHVLSNVERQRTSAMGLVLYLCKHPTRFVGIDSLLSQISRARRPDRRHS